MIKRVMVLSLILCSLSMVGCIVINNGPEDSEKKSDNNTERVIVKENEISSNNTTANDYNSGNYDSEYIFYDSDVRYLNNSDLHGLSKWDLKVARNEIYARHGRLFKDDSLQKYFNSCSWYSGYISPSNFDEKVLNDAEAYNIKLINKYE